MRGPETENEGVHEFILEIVSLVCLSFEIPERRQSKSHSCVVVLDWRPTPTLSVSDVQFIRELPAVI